VYNIFRINIVFISLPDQPVDRQNLNLIQIGYFNANSVNSAV